MIDPVIVENNLLDSNLSTENDSHSDKETVNKNLPKNVFEILAQRREQIAVLHAKKGAWLSRCERLSQKTDDFANEIKTLLSMEKDLIETAKNFFTEFEKYNVSPNQLIEEMTEQQKMSFQSPRKTPETTRLTKTLTECYREIIEQSGLPWLFVDQILVTLKKDYNIVRTKSNVASVLRQGAKNNRNFKFYGRNRFGLIEKSSQK